jgi:hypothetical protein
MAEIRADYDFTVGRKVVNDTLFQIYYSYMQSVMVPIIQNTFQPNLTLPDIATSSLPQTRISFEVTHAWNDEAKRGPLLQ